MGKVDHTEELWKIMYIYNLYMYMYIKHYNIKHEMNSFIKQLSVKKVLAIIVYF